MANEVTFGYPTGKTLTFGVYTSAGTERESGTALTETPAGSGLYLGTPTTITTSDLVIIKEGTAVVGWGEYKPQIDDSDIIAEVDIVIANQTMVLNVYDET